MKKEFCQSAADEASDKNHEAYGRGAKLFDQGSYSLAKNEFTVAIDYWPEDPEAWMALGNCFDELKKPKKAEECFKKALLYCSKEKEPDLLFNLANSLFDQMRYEEAIAIYQKVSAQSPVYAAAKNNMERARKRENT